MRKYTVKDDDDLINQIQNDPELYKEFEQAELVKGCAVELIYSGGVKPESYGRHRKGVITTLVPQKQLYKFLLLLSICRDIYP